MVDIRKIETFITKEVKQDKTYSTIKSFLFLKMTTECGVEGWGEAFISNGSEKNVEELIHNLGKNKTHVNSINPSIFSNSIDLIDEQGADFDLMCALSAFEMALWDISGKIQDKSLSGLFLESNKNTIQIYANTWSDIKFNNHDVLNNAISQIDENFNSIKIYPLQNRNVNEASLFVKELRREIGESINIMIDLECPSDTSIPHALEKKILDCNPFWYEEPIEGDNIFDLATYKKASNFKIVTGEKQSGIKHFSSLINQNAADVLNPDISAVGGITYMLKIASIAADHNILVSPHCWNSMAVSGSAMMHVCNIIPNNERAEIFPEYMSFIKNFASPGFEIHSGEAILLDRPGLGVIIDEKELRKLTHKYLFSNI